MGQNSLFENVETWGSWGKPWDHWNRCRHPPQPLHALWDRRTWRCRTQQNTHPPAQSRCERIGHPKAHPELHHQCNVGWGCDTTGGEGHHRQSAQISGPGNFRWVKLQLDLEKCGMQSAFHVSHKNTGLISGDGNKSNRQVGKVPLRD